MSTCYPHVDRLSTIDRLLRRLLPYVAYPAVMTAAIAFSLAALGRGWPAWAVGVSVVAVATVVVELLERVIPYSRAWSRSRGDRLTDALHFFVSNRAFDFGTFVAIMVFVPIGQRIGWKVWPQGWPLVAQAGLALVLVELPWYWIHRLEHRVDLLWRVHSVHHSSERLYWWNLHRNHPVDNLASALVSMAPIAFLGVGEAPLALMAAFTGAHAMLQHSNIDLRTGFLDWLLTTARVHRWHHSPKREEADANYCPTVTVWDWVFGTRRFDPDATPPEDVGLGIPYPKGWRDHLAAPFLSPAALARRSRP